MWPAPRSAGRRVLSRCNADVVEDAVQKLDHLSIFQMMKCSLLHCVLCTSVHDTRMCLTAIYLSSFLFCTFITFIFQRICPLRGVFCCLSLTTASLVFLCIRYVARPFIHEI